MRDAKITPHLQQRGTPAPRGVGDHTSGRRMGRAADHRPTALDDARLLAGDPSHGPPEQLHVVEADARDHGDDGTRYVRRVEPTAEPGLEDGEIDPRPCEMQEGGGRHHLEPRRPPATTPRRGPVERLDRRDQDVEDGDQCRRADGTAIDADALLERVHMGGHVPAGAVARCREDGGQHRDRRSLAFGPRDMHDGERVVRSVEACQQPPHPAEPEIGTGLLRRRPLEVDTASEPVEHGGPPLRDSVAPGSHEPSVAPSTHAAHSPGTPAACRRTTSILPTRPLAERQRP